MAGRTNCFPVAFSTFKTKTAILQKYPRRAILFLDILLYLVWFSCKVEFLILLNFFFMANTIGGRRLANELDCIFVRKKCSKGNSD